MGWMGFLFVGACTASKMIVSYATPEETFRTWEYAAHHLDLDVLVSTYAETSQSSLRQEMVITSSEGLKAMQEEVRLTKFKIEKIIYEGNRAYLRVQRSHEGTSEVEVVTMVKEGLDWKILP